MKERVLTFGDDQSLVGILTEPDDDGARPEVPGVVLINAGLVHRVGPNRLYTKVARRLADAGHPVLRFDLSGIGDSPARIDAMGFQQGAIDETVAAMRALGQHAGVDQFVLAGICSGADIAFLTACESQDVVGAVLINGQSLHGVTDSAGDEISERLQQNRQARYLLKQALFNPASWRKLLGARADYRSLFRTLGGQLAQRLGLGARPPAVAPRFQADFQALVKRGVRLLLAYSEGDPGLHYLDVMLGRHLPALTVGGLCTKALIPSVDHTFTPLQGQESLVVLMSQWLGEARGWTRPN